MRRKWCADCAEEVKELIPGYWFHERPPGLSTQANNTQDTPPLARQEG